MIKFSEDVEGAREQNEYRNNRKTYFMLAKRTKLSGTSTHQTRWITCSQTLIGCEHNISDVLESHSMLCL